MEKDNNKEKQSKLRNKLLKAITLTFQNAPFSPGREHKFNTNNKWGAKTTNGGGKGFSGSLVTMIPNEARTKSKEGETQEPTSPKISCMGQIKHHKKKQQQQQHSIPTPSTPKDTEVKKSKFQRMFSNRSKSKFFARKLDESASVGDRRNRAPPMGDMRRFASGRDSFANFDWKAVIEPDEIDQRDCFTDAEEEDEILIPFSAPILVGGDGNGNSNLANLKFKPRNEINLWKRRTMAPPRPLQLNPVLKAK